MDLVHGVSVVICCYNSAERLPETLHRISRQALPEQFSWEVIVVDNASTDSSAEVAVRLWSTYGRQVPFKVVTQRIPGVSAARDKAWASFCTSWCVWSGVWFGLVGGGAAAGFGSL